MCCPNFISPGVARCENCAEPAGPLFDCPVCGSEVLEGETYCNRCSSYISKDGTRGGDAPMSDFDENLAGDGYEDEDEFEEEEEEEEDSDSDFEDEDDEFY
jgi:predicted nucleic acid-binding Zn ribbon protein